MPASASKTINMSTGIATWGSTATVTRKLQGVTDATLKIISKTETPAVLGYAGPGPMAVEVAQSAEGSIQFVPTYQEMPVLLNGFFRAIDASTTTSGLAVGDGAPPYNYPYVAPVNSTLSTMANYTYCLEYGTSGAAYESNGVAFTDLSIKGEAGGIWQGTIGTVAKEVLAITTGMSTSVTDRTVTPIRMADTSLYIDDFYTGTIGVTAVTVTLISFEMTYKSGAHTKLFAGSLKPANWGQGEAEATLKFTAEFNSTAKAYIDELLSSSGATVRRQIRIRATQDSSASLKAINLDFAGIKVDGETLFGDRDGNMTVDLSWQGVYSTALGNYFETNVQNGSSSTT